MNNDELKKASEFEEEIEKSSTLDELNEVRIKYMGKKGIISLLNKVLGSLSPEERPKMGEAIQNLRNNFEEKFNAKTSKIKKALKDMALAQENIDVTLSPYPFNKGSLHPVKKIYDEIVDIFTSAGYMVAQGPEIEDDFHNFEALNLPKSHPARDMQDTFYIDENNIVLRTHTSPVQVRVMENQKPPIKIIAPGAVYRCDYDQTHSPMFHQVEGLVVDKGITMADLKGTLKLFISRIFGDDLDVRLRPSFFPFTEPSAEVDMGCVHCRGKGCRMCKGTGWIEIAGCGMVNPEVFKHVGIDPNVYSGFAFGMGIERIALLKYGIDDIRLFYENSLKFLKQF